jgi:lipoate-protein ligase A
MITVNEACGRPVDLAEVKSALIWGFCRSLGRESYHDTWSQFEKDETKRLIKEKYGTERHTLRRSLE